MIGSYKILLLGPGLPLKVSGFGKLMVHFFYLPYFLLPEYLTRSPLPLQCLVFFWKLKPNERSYFISKLFSPKTFFFFLPGDILSILLINILPLESKLKKLGRCWHKQPWIAEYWVKCLAQEGQGWESSVDEPKHLEGTQGSQWNAKL